MFKLREFTELSAPLFVFDMLEGLDIIVLFCLIVRAGQICASCTDTETQDSCQHHIECADEEVGATYYDSAVNILRICLILFDSLRPSQKQQLCLDGSSCVKPA